jgi:hypothetical protein
VLRVTTVLLAILVLVGICIVTAMWWQPILVHLSQETGTSNATSRAYDFWSGFGSDIGEVAIIGAVIGMYRKHNCHVHGCWRVAKHPVEGTPYVVCKKHHPTVPDLVTADHVADAHRARRR